VKHTNLELDTRIPLIVSAPGRKAPGRGSDGFVETVDVASTLAELSGLEIPAHWEGSSFVPLLDQPDLEWKRAVFSRYHSKDSQGQDAEGSAIRTRDWRYIEWRNRKSGKVLGRDLFDHRKDELESFNLAGDPRYDDIVDELSALLADGNGWRSVRNALEAEMAK
jgi:arylsulfatase A-like enzyme